MKLSRLFGSALLLLFAGLVQAEQAKGPTFDFKKDQRIEQDIKRDLTSKPEQIIAMAGIKKGMVVADVLGGGGYYSELLSQKVGPDGKVYLHNNKAYMPYVGTELAARLKDDRLHNVIRYDRETDNLGFQDNSLDAVFFVLGFHDMYYVDKGWKIDANDFIDQLHRALKPGGKLLIVDHSALAGTGSSAAQKLHRIDKAFVKSTLAAHGFKLLQESDVLANANDSREISPFEPSIRRKTDRFVLVLQK